MKKKKARPELALGNRYIAAWGEINARITARDHVIQNFMTLTFAVLAAVLISKDKVLAELLPLVVASIALITTFIFVAHEFLIGLLSAHLIEIAKANGGVPKWGWPRRRSS